MPLADLRVRSIVRAVADAANRWSDADFPPRVRALDAVCARTGYSVPVVEYALDRLFASISADALEAVIAAELGSLDALDCFVERPGRPAARAFPIGRVCIISSRTTVGVALVPAIFALCAKCEVLVKDREDRLVEAFFSTLVQEHEAFATAAAAQAWDGAAREHHLDTFDCVVAFGNDATLAGIAATLSPNARFVPYGSRASVGYVSREALGNDRDVRELAERAARDLVLYDTEGCLSLHALFVERGGAVTPAEFGGVLARAVERASIEFPPGDAAPHGSFRVAAARDLAAFRGAIGRGAVYADAAATYCLAVDPPIDEPPAFLPRTLAVRGVDAPEEALAYVAAHGIAIEAIAVAGSRPELRETLARARVARLTRFGELQSPPLGAYHGGRPRIAEFVRWTGDET